MKYKGIFKDSSFLVQLFILIALSLLGIFLFSVLFSIYILVKNGFSMEALTIASNEMSTSPSLIRIIQLFSALGTIFFPALIAASLFSEDKKTYLKTETPISISLIFLAAASMLVIQPFINFVIQLNERMEFPEFMRGVENWMMSREMEMERITTLMLQTDQLSGLLLNLLIIGVLAAVSEEFLFRGVLQQMVGKISKNHHLVIWIVAIVFSAIHLQFYGFFARMLMGAYFGYLLYFSRCIWIPVIAHFTNNAFGVLGYYMIRDPEKMEELEHWGVGSNWWIALVSLALWGVIFYMIRKKSLSEHLSS